MIAQRTMAVPSVFAFAALLAIFATPACADDWPQFRGPNRDGVWRETGLLQSIPADGLKIVWRTPVGFGWSSPVVANGRVIVTDVARLVTATKERILCFDETSGKLLWFYDYDVIYPEWATVHGQGGGPSATPIINDEKVYALGPDAHLHCLDARTGELVWKRKLNKQFLIKQLSCRPSPLIDGDLLVVFIGGTPGASVLAIDKGTGDDVWRALDDPISNSSPVILEAGGARQLIVWSGESVASLNISTGKTYWREPMTTSNNDAIPTPVAQNNRLLVSGLMFGLDPSRPAATVLWPGITPTAKRLLSNTSTPVLDGDYIYSARSGGALACLEAATGNRVWETNTVTERKSGASIHITPAGDVSFLFTDEGNLILAHLTPQGYTELGRVHLLEPTTPFAGKKFSWAPPAYANKHIFARNDTELVCASLAAP